MSTKFLSSAFMIAMWLTTILQVINGEKIESLVCFCFGLLFLLKYWEHRKEKW